MDSSKGYRLKTASIAELSQFLDDFRADALRVLGKKYGMLVAGKAVSNLDSSMLGLSELGADPFGEASAHIKNALRSGDDGMPAHVLNCAISIHLVRDAVLATFVHGSKEYLRAWESMRNVVSWGWDPTMERPTAVTEKNWIARSRYWEEVLAKPNFGSGMKFVLIDGKLPDLGWGGIRRYIPGYEARIKNAISLLKASDAVPEAEKLKIELLRNRAVRVLDEDITKASFSPRIAPPVARKSGAVRIRQEAKAARETAAKKKPVSTDDGRAASIDHADIMVAADGRTFIAAPYVGLDTDNRVFVQVGDNHIAVSQGGLQYGYVTGVQRSAIDVLRLCKTVILVEIDRNNGERLLRAKHVAIVSDISLSENFNLSLGGFKRPARLLGEKEISEWDSRQ